MATPDTAVPIGSTAGLPATQIAALIASGERSAASVVDDHIAHIEAVNPRINAIVTPMFDEARAAAAGADAARERGEPLGPLHGVPITIKDQFFVRGTPTTFGLESRAGHRADADGPLVERLRQAGAIVLGKGNVPQLLMYLEADNPLFGKSLNPWDSERTPGGGTGGDAAIIAAGGPPLALAADFTGSIRVPAHSCGIAGFKPTSGRLTNVGFPPELFFPGQDGIMMSCGMLGRTTADVTLAMRVLAEPGMETADNTLPPVPWRDPAAVDVAGLRIGYYEDDGFFPASPALRRAVRESAAALEAMGATVVPFSPPSIRTAVRISFMILGADGGAWVRRAMKDDKPDPRINVLLRIASIPGPVQRMLPRALSLAGQAGFAETLRSVRELSASGYWKVLDARNRYRRAFQAAMDAQQLDAIISPPYALPALRHGATYHLFSAASYSIVYNLLGMPAGTIPATRVRPGEESDRPDSRDIVVKKARETEDGSAGLPVGVQVASRNWRDEVALAVMQALESHFRTQPDFPVAPPR